MSDYKLRLDSETADLLRSAYPSCSNLSAAIDLAARDIAGIRQLRLQQDVLLQHLADHAQAQADVSAKQANHLESIALTIDAGLAAQRAVADELTKLAASIAGSVELLIKPELGDDMSTITSMHEVMSALSGIATGIEGLGRAIGALSDQIAEVV